MRDQTLRDRLANLAQLGPPTADMRRNRQRLCDFVRSAEDKIFTADPGTRARLRDLLGWDDGTFHAFIASPMLTHSSPHVSMNAFSPMLAFPWVHRAIQMLAAVPDGRAVHLRTLVMHNNLGDLRWRPYAWWYRDSAGRAVKTALFSRGHAAPRQVVLAKSVPEIDPAHCQDVDREGLLLAANASNFAYFAMIYRMHVERAAGFHLPGGTMEVPLNLLNAFTLTVDGPARWIALAGGMDGARRVADNGELEAMNEPCPATLRAHAVICTNTQSFAQVYQFGISAMTGAEKMARYVPAMNAEIESLYRRLERSYPAPELVTIAKLPEDPGAPAADTWPEDAGITAPLAIRVADHGQRLASLFEPLLSRRFAEFMPAA